jgi:hypothetical protein
MACPRLQDYPGACEYDTKKKTCKTPNPWIQHLIMYGKQGLTMRQIRRKYRSGMNEQSRCTLVRKNIRDRQLNLTANPKTFLLDLPEERRIRPTTMINRVLYELEHKHKFPIAPVPDPSTWITEDSLKTAFDVIDHHFAGGDLGRFFDGNTGVIEFTTTNNPADGNTAFTICKYVDHPVSDIIIPSVLISFNLYCWSDSIHPVRSYDTDNEGRHHNVNFRNILESFVAIFLHEISHAINGMDPFVADDGHGPNWKKISRNLWGFAGELVDITNLDIVPID